MHGAPSEGSHQRRTERGTTLTEAAFVTLPFFLIIFGILEMGFLFRNYLTISNTAAEAGRAASVYGSNVDADFQILRAAEHGVAAMGVEQLDYLVVWRATGPDDQVPDACRPDQGGSTRFHPDRGRSIDPADDEPVGSGETNRECNIYLPGDFSLNYLDPASPGTKTTHFGCENDPDNVDWGWCPLVREDAVNANGNTGPDFVGIYVQMNHVYLTGFIQSESTLSSQKIVRIEPEAN